MSSEDQCIFTLERDEAARPAIGAAALVAVLLAVLIGAISHRVETDKGGLP